MNTDEKSIENKEYFLELAKSYIRIQLTVLKDCAEKYLKDVNGLSVSEIKNKDFKLSTPDGNPGNRVAIPFNNLMDAIFDPIMIEGMAEKIYRGTNE